ncbi:MAG TPA: hypothetical protein VL688_12675 [Verrucomicrobiae bacterium]|nr:hypothetical protein [Verrucomicrobiae bacterium]
MRGIRPETVWGTLFFMAVLTAHPGISPAQNVENVDLTFIVASNEGTANTVANPKYNEQLKKMFSYSSYVQSGEVKDTVEFNKPKTVAVPGDYELELTLKNCEEGRCIMRAVIRKGGKDYVDTIISLMKPGVFLLGGPRADMRDLIIVIEMGF